MRDITTKILFGDSREVLKWIDNNMIDLIATSPPYADRIKNTYGGIAPEKYYNQKISIQNSKWTETKKYGKYGILISLKL